MQIAKCENSSDFPIVFKGEHLIQVTCHNEARTYQNSLEDLHPNFTESYKIFWNQGLKLLLWKACAVMEEYCDASVLFCNCKL